MCVCVCVFRASDTETYHIEKALRTRKYQERKANENICITSIHWPENHTLLFLRNVVADCSCLYSLRPKLFSQWMCYLFLAIKQNNECPCAMYIGMRRKFFYRLHGKFNKPFGCVYERVLKFNSSDSGSAMNAFYRFLSHSFRFMNILNETNVQYIFF